MKSTNMSIRHVNGLPGRLLPCSLYTAIHTMLDTQSILDAAEILSWNIFQADGSSDVKIMDWNRVEPISLSKALSQGGAYAGLQYNE